MKTNRTSHDLSDSLFGKCMKNTEFPWVKFRNPILKFLPGDKHGDDYSVHKANAYFYNAYAIFLHITCDIK